MGGTWSMNGIGKECVLVIGGKDRGKQTTRKTKTRVGG
jgi:hypothetical protein